jgi:hypothetical protein
MPRRIYTDGRDWPSGVEPAFAGYSIGRWIDEDGSGRYAVLDPRQQTGRHGHARSGR